MSGYVSTDSLLAKGRSAMKIVEIVLPKTEPLIYPVREYFDYDDSSNGTKVFVSIDDLVVEYHMIWIDDVDKELYSDMWQSQFLYELEPFQWTN